MAGLPSYETVIGIEVHAQLLTKTKLFCGDTTAFGAPPNTQVSAISLGHPGTLPRLNSRAIELAVRLGLACDCEIAKVNHFARKNYFYPDLPKGYQISQHITPICRNGFMAIGTGENRKQVRINRIHIEEDAGKSKHDQSPDASDIDFNRAGMPLIEIVSEPDIRSADEAYQYINELRQMVRQLDVCDGNMEEGSFRCDVNISVRRKGDTELGTKVEVKNLNSLRFIKKAIEYESKRLISLLENGEKILQQTRGFNEDDFTTYAIRTKEDEDDYRYFPEPDLPPFHVPDELIEKIRGNMPELSSNLKQRLMDNYQLPEQEASIIAGNQVLSRFFFNLAETCGNHKNAATWTAGPLRTYLESGKITDKGMEGLAKNISDVISLVNEGKINHGTAVQKILPAVAENPDLDLKSYIEQNDFAVLPVGEEMDRMIEDALIKHSQKITEYKKGKKGLISLFVGEVMKISGGKADARMVTQKIIDKLKS